MVLKYMKVGQHYYPCHHRNLTESITNEHLLPVVSSCVRRRSNRIRRWFFRVSRPRRLSIPIRWEAEWRRAVARPRQRPHQTRKPRYPTLAWGIKMNIFQITINIVQTSICVVSAVTTRIWIDWTLQMRDICHWPSMWGDKSRKGINLTVR